MTPSLLFFQTTDWLIDYTTPGGVDKEGWQYATDFPASYNGKCGFTDYVRRLVSAFSVLGVHLLPRQCCHFASYITLQEEVGAKVPLADDRTVEATVPDETRRHIDAGK